MPTPVFPPPKPKLFEWCFAPLYENQLRPLANQLPTEKWSFEGKTDYGILRRYLIYTYDKLLSEQELANPDQKSTYIYEGPNRACFHTGLFDTNWQPVYFCCAPNLRTGEDCLPWAFCGFCNSYTIEHLGIPASAAKALRRADYFMDPCALIYNTHLSITPQWDHILDDEEN